MFTVQSMDNASFVCVQFTSFRAESCSCRPCLHVLLAHDTADLIPCNLLHTAGPMLILWTL